MSGPPSTVQIATRKADQNRAALALTLAVALGAALAYHPRTRARVDTVGEAEAPKATLTYAAVGALTWLMVVQYGLVVGFGIGGLFRFRTTLPSVAATSQIIFATLVRLSCGLHLPLLGVLATACGVALLFVLESTVTYCVEVKGLGDGQLAEASGAYRTLTEVHCGRMTHGAAFPRAGSVCRSGADAFTTDAPTDLRGAVDWEVE